MGNFTTRITSARLRETAASRLIQLGVGNMTAAHVVRRLPLWLLPAFAGALETYGQCHECDFCAEGKPHAIAVEDYRDAAEQLNGKPSATTI